MRFTDGIMDPRLGMVNSTGMGNLGLTQHIPQGVGAVGVGNPLAGMQTGGKQGGFLSGIGDWFGGLDPASQIGLVGQGVGALGSLYGAHQQGQIMDEDRERRQRIAQMLSPHLQGMLSDAMER